MSVVRRLANHVAEHGQPLDATSREAACRAVLDLVAAAAAGIAAPGPRAVRQSAQVTMAGGSLPIWFSGQTAGLAGAVWCNASAAAALDLDDGHRIARGHPGAAIIPAALACAQEKGKSTEDLLQAIVVGYEVGVAVGAARRFYANTGMWSCFGVVAALGHLRRTPPDRLAHAFAIAGISAPNQLHAGAGPAFRAQEGSDVKEGIPWSCVTAISALYLAESGHTGPLDMLDNDEHFLLDDLAEGLGRQRFIAGNYFKFLAACRHVHAPVEALVRLMAENAITPPQIEAIEVATYSGALRLANRPRPQSFTDVQFSIPYCLGLVACDGVDALIPLTEASFDRDDAIAVAEKVSLRLDPELDARFPAETLSRVTVRVGERSFTSPVTAPRGEASATPTWAELEDKLRKVTRFVATSGQQDSLISAMRRLRAGDHAPLLHVFASVRLD